MDMTSARLLVENLLDRIELDLTTGKFRLGTISSKEKRALETLLAATSGTIPKVEQAVIPDTVSIEPTPKLEAVGSEPVPDTSTLSEVLQAEASVTLDLRALERTQAESPDVTVCLDFGTAMSKAFAIQGYSTPIELALGKRAGSRDGYPVESSLFISDDGILHFGPQAVELGTAAAALGRARFDSPKARLSMGQQVDIHRAAIGKEFNPTGIPMTEGEMITLYLGYLTDLATSELETQGYSRYCARRFARPCWSEDRNRWAEPLLRRMLAQAQVLADTFHDQWREGIPLAIVKQAMEKLRELAVLPDYLLGEGIPEPVAAAASLMLTDEAQREMFLVIDVGAGTTDFGLFLLQHNPAKDICLVRIVPGTIKYLEQAGDRVDDLLKFFVLELEGIDAASPEGRHNLNFLQSTIRLHKEALFRDGIVEVPMANSSRVVVNRESFLDSTRVKALGQLLKNNVLEVLNSAGEGFLDLMRDSHLNVVLTGGGADLPMVQSLAKDMIEVRGRRIMRRPTLHVPAWIAEQHPQFAPQYPQLAVAIGGANPELPSVGESIADFKGLRSSTYTA